MSKKKITVRRTCPACKGQGKSYGYNYCGCCKGRHKVTETAVVEDVDDARRVSLLDDDVSDALQELREGIIDAVDEMGMGGRR
ncbi:hypothetical protein [Halostagnicola larsenii]|uniref:hypothetical protein n=1 Tax=Halostagnicola larsenii TaxID=353800 RepID=UPI00146F9856|nr:hypothetical protein [Halostagnicola larsenii]